VILGQKETLAGGQALRTLANPGTPGHQLRVTRNGKDVRINDHIRVVGE